MINWLRWFLFGCQQQNQVDGSSSGISKIIVLTYAGRFEIVPDGKGQKAVISTMRLEIDVEKGLIVGYRVVPGNAKDLLSES